MTRETPPAGGPGDQVPDGGIEPKIKGIAMLEAIEALKRREDASRDRLPPRLLHYLDDSILVSSWYPESDHLALMAAIAEIYTDRGKDVWFWMGQATASHALGNLYRAMVQQGEPITTLKRFPKLWRLYRNVGQIKVQTIGTTKGLVRLYDYPFVTPSFSRMLAGYLSEAITISGGSNVLVNSTSLGQKVGTPAIWTISWR